MKKPPARLVYENDQEARYVAYFLERLALNSPAQTNIPAWRALMIQGVLGDVAVRECAIAISVLMLDTNSKHHSTSCLLASQCGNARYKLALKKYGKALSSVRALLSHGDRQSVETALLCGIICIWFEVLIKDHLSALSHLDRCLNIVQMSRVLGRGEIDSDIKEAYVKLDLQAAIHVGARAPVLLVEETKPIPYIFNTFGEAEQKFNAEYGNVMFLSRRAAAPYRYKQPDGIPLEILAEAQLLLERLEQWNLAFHYSYSCQKTQGDPRMTPQVCLLLIQYHMAVITASTCLYAEEMIYDRFLPNFNRMMQLAKKLVSWWHSRPAGSMLGVPVDMGVVQPLYMIATKCRVTSLRQNAIDMLASMPNDKGVWEGPVVASVARRAKDIEELGLNVKIDGVPEFRRIHAICFDVAQGTRQVDVEFRTRPNGIDGEWDSRKECLSY
ncbi:Zn(II)2Cys6 transcription factor [Aspergillus flavus]|uniref:Zn(II)2Cys6 transcription factor n=1 Tax=Aspergillus flavus TaxID=5059 RepID=A0AB74BYN4_ASPFL|nr:Zn(II)2Cys6 transcription factor [Aspergillus flavus]